MKIGHKKIGNGHPPLIVAEVGQAHEGSLGLAHSYIDLASEVGADAIKFQTHFAEEESTLDESFRVNFSYEDDTRFDYWKRMEFTPGQWEKLYEHAKEKNLIFLSTPFSIKAVNILNDIGISAWKIGSGDTLNHELLEAVARTRKPILLSTGMSSYEDIDKSINFIKKFNKKPKLLLFQCTTKYPSSFKDIGLNVLDIFRSKYKDTLIGLSDHSGSIYPTSAAFMKGVHLVETHICFHKSQFGPDSSSSLDPDQFKKLVETRNIFFEMNSNPVDKNRLASNLSKTSVLFGRSACFKEPQLKGTKILKRHLTFKKPGTGIKYEDINKIIGKKLKKDKMHNRILKWTDITD